MSDTQSIKCNRYGMFTIERYVAGDLDNNEKPAVESHIRECRACQIRTSQVQSQRQEFLRQHPVGDFLAEADARRRPLRLWISDLFRYPALKPAIAFAMVLVVLVLPITLYLSHTPEDLRSKGSDRISFIYRRSGQTFVGDANYLSLPGDEIQTLYTSGWEQYLSLFSIDDRGSLSFYQPQENGSKCSIPIGSGSSLYYPVAITLDTVPGVELIVGVFTTKPLETDLVRKWAGELFKQEEGDILGVERSIKSKPIGKQGIASTILLRKSASRCL